MALILSTIESQVVHWTKQGISQPEQLKRILIEYPSLSARQLAAVQVFLGLGLSDPFMDLLEVQIQRQSLLNKLTPRLEAEDAPVSLFNLYRGILRDQEACLWKLKAIQPVPVAEAKCEIPKVVPPQAVEPKPTQKRAGHCKSLLLLVLLIIGFMLCWFARLAPGSWLQTPGFASAYLNQTSQKRNSSHSPNPAPSLRSPSQASLVSHALPVQRVSHALVEPQSP